MRERLLLEFWVGRFGFCFGVGNWGLGLGGFGFGGLGGRFGWGMGCRGVAGLRDGEWMGSWGVGLV